MDKRERHFAEQDVRHYLSESLSDAHKLAFEQHLETCRTCFVFYMEIREMEYLTRLGQPVSAQLRHTVKNYAREATGKLLRVRFKVLKDTFIMMSGDSESLEFQGLRTSLAYRGKTQRGPVSFTHTIEKRTITLTLTPIVGKNCYKISITLAKREKISAQLLFADQAIETITDLREQAGFLSMVETGQAVMLILKKHDQEIFSIDLALE